jgi:hypothetical protein
MDFLYDLSEADGADPTRTDDTGADPARNGEPEGELGLVNQRDFAWRDQTGAPDDPMPGNIPGGPRDVIRGANFNSGTMEAFAVDSGVWQVENGALEVSAESLGGDAVSVFHVPDMLPQYFEIQASITMEKPTAGWKANSYVIFDYYSPTDFKFAGLNASIDKIQIGHRDETGWHVDVQDNMKIKPGEFYNVLVAINGTTVTVLANNTEYFTHTFAPRVIDGWVYGLNSGMVGFGSDNSRGVYDNIAVQVLPPETTLEGIEEFPDTDTRIDLVSATGQWQYTDGRYDGEPEADGGIAVSLVDLGLDRGLEVSSVLELEATLNTNSVAGVVFDYYAPERFKFAAIDATENKAMIGHFTEQSGWVIDATFDIAIEQGVDYDLVLSLKGTMANLSVKQTGAPNWQAMVGAVYNAVTVDGDFGLLSKDGSSSFDDVRVKTNDVAFRDDGDNLMAAAAPTAPVSMDALLSEDDLALIVGEAIDRWTEALGIDNALVDSLYDISFQIVNFEDRTLGQALEDTILIDIDAAGYGWFVDETPFDNTEFGDDLGNGELAALSGADAEGRMDLLTVVMHELGHVLGFDDVDEGAADLMSETLDAGTRQLVDDYTNNDWVLSDKVDERISAVSMAATDHEFNRVAPKLAAAYRSSWLADFLFNGSRNTYNPFNPTEDIKIRVDGDEEDEA